MFAVEIHLHDLDEEGLTARMIAMREWLDHCRFEPSTFRYTFTSPGILFNVGFKAETEATAFAQQFGGRILPAFADTHAS
jgi:hypothetical protein